MRAGVCNVQQALTTDAASMVKQALGLARRRGHAHVTPLHVASTTLASSNNLLRKACLRSHSHPLQFKALELCFNVALNRLPASTSSPLLAPTLHHNHNHHHPSLSNALVAAFKRAQAHQRRGSTENHHHQQQQPMLAIKIELEHLVISILDDPSVSRVMREAGFSSPQVKTKVELLSVSSNDQNVTDVLNTILSRRGNTMVIGESVTMAESVVKGVMDKFDKGEVTGDLRHLKFITLPLSSLRNLGEDEVEQKLVELKCLVKNYIGRGVVLYLGDLEWISEFRSSYGEQRRSHYFPVEHIIMEIKRLMSGTKETRKLFVMGITSFGTYTKCKTGHPSLESIWELHPLIISDDNLSLSLNLERWPLAEPEANKNHRSLNHRLFNFDDVVTSSSSLPSWMQHYKEETKPNLSHENCKKRNSFSSTSTGKDHRNTTEEGEPKSSPKEHQFWLSEKPDLLSNPNSSPNSASSSETIHDDIDGLNTFKALNEQNMNILCNALEKKVPCHKDVIRKIVSTILECRSGTRHAKTLLNRRVFKEETWLFFLGSDDEAKQNIARELARIIFGSRSSFVSISLSDRFVSKMTDSKRKREDSGYILERLGEALDENPHRVFFIEDMEQVDSRSMKCIERAIGNGNVTVSDRVSVPLTDAIVIFSSERFSSRRRQSVGDEEEMKEAEMEQKEKSSCVSLDLNIAIGDNSEEDRSRTDEETGILKWVDNQIMFRAKEQSN